MTSEFVVRVFEGSGVSISKNNAAGIWALDVQYYVRIRLAPAPNMHRAVAYDSRQTTREQGIWNLGGLVSELDAL